MNRPPGEISPYKGLSPYSEEDAQFFFGREAEREIITANLIASQFTVLYGASGVGKSSVLRAGVAHHLDELATQNLRERGTPEFIVVSFNSWRDDPVTSLRTSVQNAVTKMFNDPSLKIMESESSLTSILYAWTQQLNSDLLIILDQFEEYFLYHPQEDTNNFDIEFPRAVNRRDLRTNFLISIREDGLAKLDRYKGRIPNLFDNYLRLEYLDFEMARSAITKPIEKFNRIHPEHSPIKIEPALIDAVLEQVKTGEVVVGEVGRGETQASNSKAQIETPYLQLVMTRLWNYELQHNSRVLRLGTLNRLGSAKSIVNTHLDRVMSNLSKVDQLAASVFFQYLVTPSGSKIAYPVSDLITYSGRSKVDAEHILKVLENERVLRYIPPPMNQLGTVRYEIYHDVLARSILDWRSRFLQNQKLALRGKLLSIIGIILLVLFVTALVYSLSSEGETGPAWLGLLCFISILISVIVFPLVIDHYRRRVKR